MNTETTKRIQITLDKTKTLTVSGEQVYLPEAIQLCLAAIEAFCRKTLDRADDPNLKKSLEEDMYEMINLGASSLLDKLFPSISMRPDITVDAILKAENELIQDDEALKSYSDAYNASAQAQKDIYEHSLINANLRKQEQKQTKNKKK